MRDHPKLKIETLLDASLGHTTSNDVVVQGAMQNNVVSLQEHISLQIRHRHDVFQHVRLQLKLGHRKNSSLFS